MHNAPGSEAVRPARRSDRRTTPVASSSREVDGAGGATIDLAVRRRLFAEEIEAVARLRTGALVSALASVPRERFLRPGPWFVAGDTPWAADPYMTPDADPRHVYHNCSIGIEPFRLLFNGPPGRLAVQIDPLDLQRGARVLHIGAGLGYYSAIFGHIVGPSGRVLAIEVDETLAAHARANLTDMPWIELRHGGGTGPFDEAFDAIFLNAGVTHPQAVWLDALAPGGKLILPLTCGVPNDPTSTGLVVLIDKTVDAGGRVTFGARSLTHVAIFSGIGLRDDAREGELRAALKRMPFPDLRRLRGDPHDAGPSCWVHGPAWCLSLT